jgi:magnesium transporter
MPLVDNAVYVNGVRTADPINLDETHELSQERKGFAWIALYRPTEEEVRLVASEFDLHHLAVDDALAGHQRPKLERYGDTLFLVLRPARYVDSAEQVEFGEVHLFVGPDFVVSILHAESPNIEAVRERVENEPELLARGPRAVMYAVLDQVVDEYLPVVSGLETDIDEIEDQLFGFDPTVSRRIYELSREVIAFQRATQPLQTMLSELKNMLRREAGAVELKREIRDVEDHIIRVVERVDGFRALLQNALVTHSTLIAQRQNDETRTLSETSLRQGEEVKKISSWAAILFAPTLVGAIYGMNFEYMPELQWRLGYPFSLGLMVALGGGLYAVFKKKGWL